MNIEYYEDIAKEYKETVNFIRRYNDILILKSLHPLPLRNLKWKLQRLKEKTNLIYSVEKTFYTPRKRAFLNSGYDYKYKKPSKDNIYIGRDIKKIKDYFNGEPATLITKLKGVAIKLIYFQGALSKAFFKSDTEERYNLVNSVRNFMNVPLRIPCDKTSMKLTVINGIATSDYLGYKLKLKDIEPENEPESFEDYITSCILEVYNKEIIKANIHFFANEIIEANIDNKMLKNITRKQIDFNSLSNRLDYLASIGFDTLPYKYIEESNYITKSAFEVYLNQMIDEGLLKGFDVEQIMFILDNEENVKNLQTYNKIYDTNQIAYRIEFKTDKLYVKTKITNIDYKIDAKGHVTPIIWIKGVDGKWGKQNLIYFTGMKDIIYLFKNKAFIGQTIYLSKSKTHEHWKLYSIKQYTKRITDKRKIIKPINKCPSCGKPLLIYYKKYTGTFNYICKNYDCKDKTLEKLVVTCKNLEIKYLQRQRLKYFMDRNIINSDYLISLYNILMLPCTKLNMRKVYRMKKVIGWHRKAMIKSIEQIKKDIKLDSFISALGIDNINCTQAKKIAKYFDNSIEKFNKSFTIKAKDTKPLITEEIVGLMDKPKNSFNNFFINFRNRIKVKRLISILKNNKDSSDNEKYIIVHPNEKEITLIKDLFFFIAEGNLKHFSNRDNLTRFIKEREGYITTSVNFKTDYVIGNKNNKTADYVKIAEKLNIPIISENEFLNMFGYYENL